MTRACRFPNCDAVLHPKNVSGLCTLHNHTRGLCRCAKCAGQPVVRNMRRDKPDVRVATVVTAMAFSTSSDVRADRVSLKREPWA